MSRRFQQVDVFTDRVGSGNPVAVVLDSEGLADVDMARFAAWTNLSETTFVQPPSDPDADYRVRIFTPAEELPFAGHPTIGTCHAWLVAGGSPKSQSQIVQECGAGLVTLKAREGRLAFATPPLTRSGPVSEQDLAAALDAIGVSRTEVAASAWVDNGPGWLGVRLHSLDQLRSLRPNLAGIDAKIGVVALTGATEPAIEVRAFFTVDGTREDPVTGSLNGSVAQWLLGDGTLVAPYVSSQGGCIGRDGRVHISADNEGIWVGGDAVTAIEGSLEI